jgi:hypothetical protein
MDLILAANKLNAINNSMFEGLKILTVLDLNKQQKIRFSPNSFNSCPSLRILDIGGNDLTYLEPELFDELKDLKLLNLRSESNNFEDIEFLSKLKRLEFLDISGIDEHMESFNQIEFESLKFLVLTTEIVPKLSKNFGSLQGLEIRGMAGYERKPFENLQLDYLKLTLRSHYVLDKIGFSFIENVHDLVYFAVEVQASGPEHLIKLDMKAKLFECMFSVDDFREGFDFEEPSMVLEVRVI